MTHEDKQPEASPSLINEVDETLDQAATDMNVEDTKKRITELNQQFRNNNIDPLDYSEQKQILEYKLSLFEETPQLRNPGKLRRFARGVFGVGKSE